MAASLAHHRREMVLQQRPNQLATIRLARGLSAAELARRVGCHRSLVSKIEHGHIAAWPAFRRRTAEVLQVDEELLFGDAMR